MATAGGPTGGCRIHAFAVAFCADLSSLVTADALLDKAMGIEHSRLAVRAIVAIYREFEQIARRSDISMAQYRLLIYLRNGPRRAGAIAAAAEIAKPTASLAIAGLREKGWIESIDDADGRALVVAITAAGDARMTSFEHDLMAAMTAMVATDEMHNLAGTLAGTYVAMDATKEMRLKSIESGFVPHEPAPGD